MMHNTGITSAATETVTGALSVTGPQPVWMTLDEARERAFTGEVVFEVDPEVQAYLDQGIVYYAERTSDAPLGRRLLDAGVVDTSQLERGTVRVGDVEHLGRLFDREPSVDRDAVLVVTETWTEDLVAQLANQAVTTVRVTAYRHHPSGIHRWFVAQIDDQAAASRPVGSSNPLDATVIEELPGLSVVDDDELSIEWNDLDEVVPTHEAEVDEFEPFVDEPIAIDFGSADPADDSHGAAALAGAFDHPSEPAPHADTDTDTDTGTDVDEPAGHFEYQVTWPDGTEDLVDADAAVTTEQPVLSGPPMLTEPPVVTEADDGTLHFEMPELALGDDDASVDEVPDDVADAVRRAIAAIESASVEQLSESVDVDTFDADLTTEPVVESSAAGTDQPAAPVTPGAFAPPTMDMRAEVMYAQAERAAAEEAPIEPTARPSLPTAGVVSIVFVDDEPEEDSGNERSSALRRLIGSLRRKDH